ncbi:hypothetical protein E3E14_05625 [Streptomyces sp. ICN441]|uniref:Uncharacterized protein n=1 Tax=Streptomyces tirandamycinicus TaxID=2174846 RepID=A0A2S1SQR9_9ACTN|nr:hypothetical protein DDW44_08015 [Streptomyces tirandamycinicus]TFE55614.1 hypothetical protein E3E14_05625 [Streptomyces sp. ICN441]
MRDGTVRTDGTDGTDGTGETAGTGRTGGTDETGEVGGTGGKFGPGLRRRQTGRRKPIVGSARRSGQGRSGAGTSPARKE